MTTRIMKALLILIPALILISLIGVVADTTATPQKRITIQFATSPGLFKGNHVDILGMPVGHVVSVTPGPTYVTVVVDVPKSTKIPAGATAEIMAPDIVNDRYVQLDPPYTGGPTLGADAIIPMERTEVPISVDEIIDSLDRLAVALGPQGSNANGALSALIAGAAKGFGGDGSALHATLTNLGSAFSALSSKGPQLTDLINSLGNLSQVATNYTTQYQTFSAELATVSTDLAGDDSSLASALSNLQQALGQLDSFIAHNSATLGASVKNLSVFAGAVAQKQAYLEQVLGVLPVALGNLNNAFDPTTHALRARYDPQSSSDPFARSVCGNPLLRLLLVALAPSQDKDATIDLDCGVNGLLTALPVPPGGASGPNLSISALVSRGA